MALSQLRQSDGSVVMTIPQSILDQLGIEAGQKVELNVKDGSLIVKQHHLSLAKSELGREVARAFVAFADEWKRVRAGFESAQKEAVVEKAGRLEREEAVRRRAKDDLQRLIANKD